MYKIEKKEALTPTVTRMVIQAPFAARKAKAGQFVILRVHENSERIPLTIADYNRETGSITIIYQVVGGATEALNQLEVGATVADFVGPLGQPSEVETIKKAVVVGGGVGCAIAFPIVKALSQQESEVFAVAGFRNKDLVILEDEFKHYSDELTLMTDDGSYGEQGFVTNGLEAILKEHEDIDCVYAIGPLIMMKHVALLTQKYNVHTVVSMNPIMIDGTGMCGGCRLTVGGETKFACIDGPEFDGHLVDFGEAMKRNNLYKKHPRKEEDNCNLMNKEVDHAK